MLQNANRSSYLWMDVETVCEGGAGAFGPSFTLYVLTDLMSGDHREMDRPTDK